ncbi:sulfate adenylyltransferase [Micrococcales bacterium KH10]|nr:sulfate adenylyltransferase [Micrococcales bacterium KH10]
MSELAQIVLDGSGVDMVEAMLSGFVSPQDVVVRGLDLPTASGGSAAVAAAVRFLDAENTPIGEVELVRAAELQDAPWSIQSVAPVKPLARQHGVLADVRYRVPSTTVAGYFAQGRETVLVAGLPAFADLDQVWQSLGDAAQAPVWCVLSSRARGGLDPAAGIARAIAETIDRGELRGDLVVIPDVSVAADPAYPRFEFVDSDLNVASLLTRLGASNAIILDSTLDERLSRVAPRPVLDEYQRSARRTASKGAVVLFSGLSGSGKSTVAKAFAARVEAEGVMRTVLVDGDEARQMLSAGLGFDRASRDLNVERLGYVASMASSVGALAVLAPIAPFAEARGRVRQRAEAVGEFILIHISTPLEICEARDRKGLYAKARAGEIPDFTGISSPYEEPTDADLAIDTGAVSVDEAVDQVWELAAARLGWA